MLSAPLSSQDTWEPSQLPADPNCYLDKPNYATDSANTAAGTLEAQQIDSVSRRYGHCSRQCCRHQQHHFRHLYAQYRPTACRIGTTVPSYVMLQSRHPRRNGVVG